LIYITVEIIGYYNRVNITIRYSNKNNIGIATILVLLGALGMLQRCSGNTAEMVWYCYIAIIVAAAGR